MALKVIQDWQDRCTELRLRMDEAFVEYQRAASVLNRALDDEPRVCMTCQRFESGICGAFKEAPPQEFQERPSACEAWEALIPF
jgi:hypothetical protein